MTTHRHGRPVRLLLNSDGTPHSVISVTDEKTWVVISSSRHPTQPGAWTAQVHGPQPGYGHLGDLGVVLTPDDGSPGGHWMDLNRSLTHE